MPEGGWARGPHPQSRNRYSFCRSVWRFVSVGPSAAIALRLRLAVRIDLGTQGLLNGDDRSFSAITARLHIPSSLPRNSAAYRRLGRAFRFGGRFLLWSE